MNKVLYYAAADRIAAGLDRLAYDYSYFDYVSDIEDTSAHIAATAAALIDDDGGQTMAILEWLQGVIGDRYDDNPGRAAGLACEIVALRLNLLNV